jgi:hypothetical protein
MLSGVVLVVVGVILLTVGVLFLLASALTPTSAVSSILLALPGGVLVWWGARRINQGEQLKLITLLKPPADSTESS